MSKLNYSLTFEQAMEMLREDEDLMIQGERFGTGVVLFSIFGDVWSTDFTGYSKDSLVTLRLSLVEQKYRVVTDKKDAINN